MRSFVPHARFRALFVGLLVLTLTVVLPLVVHAGGLPLTPGMQITIHAVNRTNVDTSFCGVGGGLVGDTLDASVFMNDNGTVTGWAVFQDALGNLTTIDISHIIAFTNGLVLQDAAFVNAVVIWMVDLPQAIPPGEHASSQTFVSVETPRGCPNTKSTFTPGLDKVQVTIKIK